MISQFVADLESEDVFAKEINTAGIAYHSYFMQSITNRLMEKFEQVLTHPKPRSQKWISTSVPEWLWETSPISQNCSANYWVNNVTAPVLFHEALQKIPENAVVIEVCQIFQLQAMNLRSDFANLLNIEKKCQPNIYSSF